MPNKKISQLDPADLLAGSEQVPVVQDGVTVRTTISALQGVAQFASTWAAARDASATTAVDVVTITDSIGVLGSSTVKPWPWLLGKSFSAFESRADGVGWLFARAVGAPAFDTCGGTDSTAGLGGYSADMAIGNTATVTTTCDGVSVVWTRQPGGGSIQVRDGATLVATINTDGATAHSQITLVDFGSFASRTITFTITVAASILEGGYFHTGDQTTGRRVWVAGHAGYSTDDFVLASGLGLDLIENIEPALVIIATGFNDDSDVTYESDLGLLIDAVRARTSGDVMVMNEWGGSDLVMSAAKAQVARDVARTKGCDIIDVFAAIGNVSNNVDPWDQSGDGAHPRPGASSLIADMALAKVFKDPFLIAITSPERGERDLVGTFAMNRGTTGAARIEALLGFPTLALYGNASDANTQILAFPAALATLLSLPGATVGFGAGGGSNLDTYLSRLAANQFRMSGGLTLSGTAGAGYLDLTEQSSDPAAPAANGVRLFAKDNGSGKTQLYARFNTGAIVLIATQP